MPLDYITYHWWIAIAVWVALYTADYYLTLAGARQKKGGADKHFHSYGGYELTPQYRKDIAALRPVSWRFLFWLLFGCAELTVVGLIARPMQIELLFQALFGMLVLPELHVLLRHVNNLALLYYAARSAGLRGRLETGMWLSLRRSMVDHFAYAALWLCLWAFTGAYLFAGGAFKEILIGLQHRELSQKESPELPEAPSDASAAEERED